MNPLENQYDGQFITIVWRFVYLKGGRCKVEKVKKVEGVKKVEESKMSKSQRVEKSNRATGLG